MDFVDRTRELAALRTALDARPALVRVYGRRRLGKTELLWKLCREKGGTYLLAHELEPALQLESLAEQLAASAGGPSSAPAGWEGLFERLRPLAGGFVVIDEFQRLMRPGISIESRIQHRWDLEFSKRGPSLVLCGSSVGMMRRLTKRRAAPLFGRLTADLHLRPLDFAAVRLIYPSLGLEDAVRRYAVFGGTPHYHRFSARHGLAEAIDAAFLAPQAPLADEPLDLLRMEIAIPDRHYSILQEIGRGTHSLGDIEAALQLKTGRLSPYITTLRDDLDLVRAEAPVCGVQRRSRYVLSDPFFRFYYRFISKRRALLEVGEPDLVRAAVARDLEAHVGEVFEDVVLEAFRRLNGRSWKGVKIEFEELGRWWNRRGEEVDICARGETEVLAGEVKWGGGPMKPGVLWALERKVRQMERTGGLPVRLVFASRGGFSAAFHREAERRGALLFDMADLNALLREGGPRKEPGN